VSPVRIDRPFCILVEPDPDGSKTWRARLVGHELDNATDSGVSRHAPLAAAYMAFDLLCCLADVSPRDVIDSLDEADEVQP
jgi:hypothetical protein